jgi:hypothetical protein
MSKEDAMTDEAGTGSSEVEIAVVPEDAEVREAVAAALDAGRSEATAERPDLADRVQEALRERWPAADVLLESASAPGSTGRARWTIYRDGADAA